MLSNSNVQDDTNQVSTSDSHDNEQDQVASTSSQPNDQASAIIDKVQDQQQLTSSSSQSNTSNQVQVLQPTNVARDHPLDSIIGDISRGVQTRSRLASFYEHFSFVSSIEPKKIDEALLDVEMLCMKS